MLTCSAHGFSEARSCLTNPMAFCGGVTSSVDKGRATYIVYLHLGKHFDEITHGILTCTLQRYGFDGWTLSLIRIGMDGHTQRIAVNGSISKCKPLMGTVPAVSSGIF